LSDVLVALERSRVAPRPIFCGLLIGNSALEQIAGYAALRMAASILRRMSARVATDLLERGIPDKQGRRIWGVGATAIASSATSTSDQKRLAIAVFAV